MSKKIKLKLGSSEGFSLVEAMITGLLFAIIFGACLVVLLAGSENWHVNKLKVELQQELRKANDWLKEDLHQSGPNGIVNVFVGSSWYGNIEFKTSAGVSGGNIVWSTNNLNYFVDPDERRLRRSVGTDNAIIANFIESFQVRRPSSNIVEVQITAQNATETGKVISETANFQIQLRN